MAISASIIFMWCRLPEEIKINNKWYFEESSDLSFDVNYYKYTAPFGFFNGGTDNFKINLFLWHYAILLLLINKFMGLNIEVIR